PAPPASSYCLLFGLPDNRVTTSYWLRLSGGCAALRARPSKSTFRFVRLPQKRERGRTRSSDLGGSRVPCARPPKSKCRFVRLPQKRERGRTRLNDLGGSRALCARPPQSKCRFVRLPRKRDRWPYSL